MDVICTTNTKSIMKSATGVAILKSAGGDGAYLGFTLLWHFKNTRSSSSDSRKQCRRDKAGCIVLLALSFL